jgi:hypothetical protein
VLTALLALRCFSDFPLGFQHGTVEPQEWVDGLNLMQEINMNMKSTTEVVKAGQTGPKTLEGKKAAAKNALKSGAFSFSLLQGEDPQDIEDLAQGLMAQYGLDCTLGQLKAQRAAMSLLQIKRVERYVASQALAVMDNLAVRQIFCERVGIRVTKAELLPDEFFTEDEKFCQMANFYLNVLHEAQSLHDRHTADLMLKVREQFKNLWAFVMGGNPKTIRDFNFGEKLATHYKQPHPTLNLRLLIDALEEDYADELLWARNEARFKSVLSGLQAEMMIGIQSDEKIHRTMSRLNKQLDSELLWLDRLASQKAQPMMIEDESSLDGKAETMQIIDSNN